MSPESRQKLSEWMTPGNIIQFIGILVMVVSIWAVNNYRLGDVSKAIEEIRVDISAIRGEQREVIRQQERLTALTATVASQDIKLQTLDARIDILTAKIALEMLIPNSVRGNHEAHRSKYMKDPRTRSMGADLILSCRRRDGEELPVQINLSPIVIPGGTFVAAVVRRAADHGIPG